MSAKAVSKLTPLNREIKFRARRATGEWAYFRLDDLIRHAPTVPSWVYEYPALKKDQFIGRNDKNGREIFGGDLVKWTDDIGENPNIFKVAYQDAQWVIVPVADSVLGWYLGEKELEVIGNISENPELLQEKPAFT
jgi:YopX protein